MLDLSIFLAGPTTGRTLGEFGADVIKIDNPYREEALIFQLDGNRGKRSVVLDLKSDEGLRVFWKLVERADVVVQNFRKGVANRMGIGYERVREHRPDVVYASMNTYGQSGPWASRPGHEQLAQAATGLQLRAAREGRPGAQPFAVCDYGTGWLGAFGVALALYHRARTGEGQHVESALAFTGTILQSPFMLEYGARPEQRAEGDKALGIGPLQRLYQAKDGWLFLGAHRSRLAALSDALGVPSLGQLPGPDLVAVLAECLADRTVRQSVDLLASVGVGAQQVVTDLQALMSDPWVLGHGLSLTRDHQGLGPVTTTGPAPRLSRTPVSAGRPAPRPDQDAAAILSG